MKTHILAACAALTLAACHTLAAEEPSDSMAGAKTANGKIAMAWIYKAFNEHKMAEAFDLYVSRENYMNHAVPRGDKPQTFEQQKALEISLLNTDSHFEIVQIVVQGDLVAMNIHATHLSDTTHNNQLVEFIRVRGGKIVDHWDWHSPVPKDGLQFVDVDRFNKPAK